MLIHDGLENFPRLDYALVTEGTFDGVHIGHQKILHRLREIAERVRHEQGVLAETVVVTFSPHPRLVLFPGEGKLRLLCTGEEKIRQLAQHGVDHLVVIRFDQAFAELSPEAYVEQVLIRGLHTKKLVIGYDHRFGQQRKGNFSYLKNNETRFGFEVEEIPRQDVDHVGVSSTKIRLALAAGDMATATQHLGHPYELGGVVVQGDQIGRTIGYPTANLAIGDPYKLIPADGIYAVRVHLQAHTYQGMLYIGNRTTIAEGLQKAIEVNIFDFSADIYQQTLRLELLALLRQEIKFDGLAAMQAQLAQDRLDALAVLQPGKFQPQTEEN
jgi:riboflavin kinase / FMN adenylyltransferase